MKASITPLRPARAFTLVRLAVVLGLLLAAVPAVALAQGTLPSTVYTTRNVYLRSGAGLGFSILAEMPGGEALTVLGLEGVWFKVRRADNTEGFVSGHFVTINPPGSGGGGGSANVSFYPVPPNVGDVAVVTASILNVRSGPGVNLPVIARAFQGTFVVVLDKSGAWRLVRLPNLVQGWVNGQWLSARIASLPQTGGGGAPVTTIPITTVVTPANAAPIEVNIVTLPRLNVRTGPSTLYLAVTTVSEGQFVTVLARQGGWRYIQTPGGLRGWSNIEGLTRCDCALP